MRERDLPGGPCLSSQPERAISLRRGVGKTIKRKIEQSERYGATTYDISSGYFVFRLLAIEFNVHLLWMKIAENLENSEWYTILLIIHLVLLLDWLGASIYQANISRKRELNSD